MDFKALAARLPEWGRLFDAQGYAAFIAAVRAVLEERGEPFELHQEYARVGDCDVPLLPLAKLPRDGLGKAIDERLAAERLGRELDSLRGDFAKARPRLKLRLQTSPGTVSAPVVPGLHAALVLDLPSFITPVRQADLAAWERPAAELVTLALENVKAQERVELKPMEIAGTRLYAVSGQSVFVASLGLAAEDLLGSPTEFGALLAVPSSHILLCHALADRRSLAALEAMAAGALQAFESGPAPLLPHLLWKRGDRFVALPVHKTPEGKVQCDIPREFDEQVAARLPA